MLWCTVFGTSGTHPFRHSDCAGRGNAEGERSAAMGGGTEHTACTTAGGIEGAGDAAPAEGRRRKAPPARLPLCLLVPFLLFTCAVDVSLSE